MLRRSLRARVRVGEARVGVRRCLDGSGSVAAAGQVRRAGAHIVRPRDRRPLHRGTASSCGSGTLGAVGLGRPATLLGRLRVVVVLLLHSLSCIFVGLLLALPQLARRAELGCPGSLGRLGAARRCGGRRGGRRVCCRVARHRRDFLSCGVHAASIVNHQSIAASKARAKFVDACPLARALTSRGPRIARRPGSLRRFSSSCSRPWWSSKLTRRRRVLPSSVRWVCLFAPHGGWL